MNRTKGLLLAAGAILLFPSGAWAQQELNPTPTDGATITSDSDGTPGEFFVVNDSADQILMGNGDDETVLSNSNNVNLNYDSDDGGAGSFALTSGGAAVLSANNAGTVTVSNAMNTNGISNGDDGITNAGAVSGVTTFSADTNGVALGGTRLVLDGTSATTTSTDGNTTNTVSNAGHVLAHVDGTATNSIAVADTTTTTVGSNSFSYGTTIAGGALVQGDLGVNGSIYALNPMANTSVAVGNNGLEISGSQNRTAMVADSNGNTADGRGVVVVEEDEAGVLVYNQTTGTPHGLYIDQNRTVLSGGTSSTTLTLSDSGAAFRNTDTGGPARVTGVANGRQKFDAVNFGQLENAHGGIASVAAMANIPAPPPGKNFAVGIGFGNFEGENAFAFGGTARVHENISLQASIGHSDDVNTFGAGVGFSW